MQGQQSHRIHDQYIKTYIVPPKFKCNMKQHKSRQCVNGIRIDMQINETEQLRNKPMIYGQLIFNKGLSFQQIMSEQLDIHVTKNEWGAWTLNLHCI